MNMVLLVDRFFFFLSALCVYDATLFWPAKYLLRYLLISYESSLVCYKLSFVATFKILSLSLTLDS